MKHARADYQRIQDPAGLIPKDEPVFLLRGKDVCAPATLDFWAVRARQAGASETIIRAAHEQAEAMIEWQRTHGSQTPDLPGDQVPAATLTSAPDEALLWQFAGFLSAQETLPLAGGEVYAWQDIVQEFLATRQNSRA